jgi:PAS domain S-box-containing protein
MSIFSLSTALAALVCLGLAIAMGLKLRSLHREQREWRRGMDAREDSLRETNQRLELATRSGSLGIWELNLADGTQIWNDQMYRIYGLERQAEHPDHAYWCRHIVHPDDLQATDAAIQEALAGRRPYDFQFRIIRPDGEIRTVKSDGHVLRDAEGRITRIVGINRDRTREVVAESEQRRLQLELQHTEKLESLGSLAGGVAHDMNNVLAAVMGMASALRTSCPDDDPRAAPLDTITRACTRGRDVIKSLLYFARKDLETPGPVNLNIIAKEMVQLLSYTTLKRIRISTDYQEPLGQIEGDAGALNHALVNLCINAVDAMPAGGALTIRTRQREDRVVEISIRDTGAGMAPEVLRKAIEPFFTTKPLGKGTGLGLAMVYGTVQAHHGTLDIQSQPGQGTEVTLGFPLLAEPAQPETVAEHPGPAAAPMRILLVDDDELVRMSVGPMLAMLGHQVDTAESGQEALDRILDGLDPDLVILDMNMPGLNGAQTLAHLRVIRPGQPVLIATGYSEDAIAPLLREHRQLHSLRKPFSLEELRNKLGVIAGLRVAEAPDR